MTKQRREELLNLLKTSSAALNGQSLAEHFHVTRQIIVQDIALLRADGAPILSTNRGYLYKDRQESTAVHQLFKVQHGRRDVQHFLQQVASCAFRPLSELTDGVHYHLIQADSQQDLDYVEAALRDLGFLQE